MTVTVKKPRAKKSVSVGSRSASQPPIELPDGMWRRISEKAYELWEQRGRREGSALQDWLDAEEMVMEEIHEARE